MGRGLLYCHIYASARTPLGTWGVGSGTEGDKGGVVASRVKGFGFDLYGFRCLDVFRFSPTYDQLCWLVGVSIV